MHTLRHFRILLISYLATFMLTSLAPAQQAEIKRVSLVFDDGPTTEQLEPFLELFAREQIRVNFCFVGRNVEAHPKLTANAAKNGHEINNHSFSHPQLPRLKDEEILQEIQKASEAIHDATGRPPGWFWAPYLALNDRVQLQLEKAKLQAFPYSKYNFISTNDWDQAKATAESIRKAATTDIQDGTIILCHEWRKETLQEMPVIIRELKAQGCTFLTFSELAKALPDGVKAVDAEKRK